jgi:hypothetical protein
MNRQLGRADGNRASLRAGCPSHVKRTAVLLNRRAGLTLRESIPLAVSAGLAITASGQKSGRPLTPKRPAFAFLVTPKLPLGGRSVKLDAPRDMVSVPAVKRVFSKSTSFIVTNWLRPY